VNEEILYNKIQLLDNGVWVINDNGQINAISLPLFVDYSRRKLQFRKFVGLIIFFGFILITIFILYLIYSIFGQLILN